MPFFTSFRSADQLFKIEQLNLLKSLAKMGSNIREALAGEAQRVGLVIFGRNAVFTKTLKGSGLAFSADLPFLHSGLFIFGRFAVFETLTWNRAPWDVRAHLNVFLCGGCHGSGR